ncbi:2Fe-2S iron-sulfur cluster binding domain-containing protein [Nitrospina gracilis]|nr:2Fe-2S iron-sulfur cluster binding domain-containing protein [Nitrospina gracilis]
MKNKLIHGKAEIFLLAWILVLSISAAGSAQVSPEEHAKHHPGQAESVNESPPGKGMGGGMMGGGKKGGGMGGMMQKMGAPKAKDLYPSLMSLPDLPLEKRADLQEKAHKRMKSGVALMSRGFEDLSKFAPTDDFASMQKATAHLREGLSQFESGLATHRALKEGKTPHNIALQWFKREMGLLPSQYAITGRTLWGLSPFHFFIMALLALFAIILIGMYFFKMRRATELLQRLVKEDESNKETKPGKPPVADNANLSLQVSPNIRLGKSWSGKLRVARIFPETPEVKTFRLVDVDGGPLPFTYEPGQFLSLSVQLNGKKIKRSYTIASSPTRQHYCEITIKREKHGLVSSHLHDHLREGDFLEISAATGKLVFSGKEEDSIVLIGGGVGITPLMSVIRYLTDTGWKKDIYFLYSCRTPEDFIFGKEIEYLKERNPNFHAVIAMSRIEKDIPGIKSGRLNKKLIAESIPEISSRRIHLCGSPPMMESMKSILAELGVAKKNLKTESFGPGKVTTKTETASISSEATTAMVSFKKSGKSGSLSPDRTILEVAEDLEIEIESSCQSGVCGTCKVKLLSGEVAMECEDGLEPEDKEQGFVLACQAKSNNDVEVDA